MNTEIIKTVLFGVTTRPFEGDPVPVEDDPDVRECREAMATAVAELSTLKAEEQNLQAIVDPPPQESHQALPSVLPEDYYDAQSRLPTVRAQRQRTAGQVQRLEKQLAKARETAKAELDDARWGMRQPLIQAVFQKFREAVEANERLVAFDTETKTMGGSESANPCPGLLRDRYDFQYALAKKDGLS